MDIYSEKRANERIAYKVPISVEDLEDGFIYRARMINYSKSGMYLETDVILDLGAEIHIGIEDSPYILSSSTSSSKLSFKSFCHLIFARKYVGTLAGAAEEGGA